MKFINFLLVSLIFLCLFQSIIYANTNETSSDSVLKQLTQIVTKVYKNLFKQIVEMPSQKISKTVEKQDGYIFNIKADKATIDLGRNDGIQQGMLLDVYRQKDIHVALKDSISLVSVPLGKVIVTEVYENTAKVYLSDFEVKTEKNQQNGKTVFSIKDGDRVKRPAVNVKIKKESPKELSPAATCTPGRRSAHILQVADNEIHIDLVKNIEAGDTVKIIKERKQAKHPITGELILLNPEKKATLKITEIRKDKSIGKIISSDKQGRFVVNDKVQVRR